METYKVANIYNRIKDRKSILKVNVPGSKSITNRALLLATLASGRSELSGVLFSDDSRNFINCVKDLGVDVSVNEEQRTVSIQGCSRIIPVKEGSVYVGSAGTAARFITAVLGVSHGKYHIDASEQMRRRPMAPLLRGLESLGCRVTYGGEPEHFPLTLDADGFAGNEITVNIDSSSQFLSALMIASVLSTEDFTIHVEGTHGMAYIDMTAKMMEQFGVEIDKSTVSGTSYLTAAGQAYMGQVYPIEPDASAADYFYAMAPLLGIPVCVPGVFADSLQGDVAFIDACVLMGCTKEETEEGIVLFPPADGVFHGIKIDMSAFSDQAITLAAIAPFADSPTTITGIGHIRLQESDRMSAICNELTKMGIKVDMTDTSLTIYPGNPLPALVDTYDDHRMAMGFSLIGLRADGIELSDPMCCRKTFENYFDVLDNVIDHLTEDQH